MGKRDGSVATALGAAVFSTTCCALPALLVTLGAGGALASLASTAPWLVTVSKYKAWTFSFSAIVLAWAWWRSNRVDQCEISDAKRLRWQKRVLGISSVLLLTSLFVAYALLPIQLWLEG